MKEVERMINCTVDFRCRPVSMGDAMFITDLHEGAVPDVGEQNGDGNQVDDGNQFGNEAGERTEK